MTCELSRMRCPKGASPGGRLRITTKSGRKVIVTIPDNVKPGDKFRVSVDKQ